MADDYDWDDAGVLEDDGWLYVEDEFDLADELAEGQVPEPGYSGTNNEIDFEGYEFDLFGYYEDLEYGDDPYFDYGLPASRGNASEDAGPKRKRGAEMPKASPGKRRKINDQAIGRESEPLVFRSRDERYRAYKQDPPFLQGKPFSFLPDWRERFADEEGADTVTKMPTEMRKAAEAQDDITPPKSRQVEAEAYAEEDGEDGWEDEDEGEDEEDEGEDDGLAIDPEMLKSILREKLGAAGLDGMDESAFMETLQKMMAGDDGEDEAAGMLADSLLGKLTSDTGDEALSGWLSQQGVSLEEDDASSVATAEAAEPAKHGKLAKQSLQSSPPDSAIDMKKSKDGSIQMPLHSGSPTASTKKRSAPEADDNRAKKNKKVQFDVTSSDSSQAMPSEKAAPPTSEDPLMSEPTVSTKATASTRANAAAAKANKSASTEVSQGNEPPQKATRKRKASSADEKPAGKKTKMRELQDLGPLPEAPSPAPPAKRTRSARAKAGK